MPTDDDLARLADEVLRLRQEVDAAKQRTRHTRQSLQGRIRTCFMTIGAVARRSALSEEAAERYAFHLDGRVNALARAHLTAMRDPAGTVELHNLIAEELLAHAAVEGEQLTLSGPDLWLCGRAVDTFWLAIHELAVNAVKFGALSSKRGHIAVAWSVLWRLTPVLHLQWFERGGPLISETPRSGFGTEVIERMLCRGLGGEAALAFTPGGMECNIAVPTSREVTLARPAPPI